MEAHLIEVEAKTKGGRQTKALHIEIGGGGVVGLEIVDCVVVLQWTGKIMIIGGVDDTKIDIGAAKEGEVGGVAEAERHAELERDGDVNLAVFGIDASKIEIGGFLAALVVLAIQPNGQTDGSQQFHSATKTGKETGMGGGVGMGDTQNGVGGGDGVLDISGVEIELSMSHIGGQAANCKE